MTSKDNNTTLILSDLGDDPIVTKMIHHGSEYRRITSEIELLEVERKSHKAEMDELAKDPRLSRVKSIRGADFQFVKVAGRVTEKIDPLLLLQNGVSAKVIEKSTTRKQGEDYYQVKPV